MAPGSVRNVALDGAPDRTCDSPQVAGIAGDDHIFAGERRDHDRGVNQIASTAGGKSLTGRARLLLGERLNTTTVYKQR